MTSNPYVRVAQGQLGPLLDSPDPDIPITGAFDGYACRPGSRTAEFMGGLIRNGWPGTDPVSVQVPVTPYQPNVKATRPSYAATEIHPTIGVALNLRLYRPGPARFASAAYNPPSQEGPDLDMPWEPMRPQPVYGDRVTDWPRYQARWLTFGEAG